jgi:uncharacterized protein (DUF486 family)
MESRRPWLRLSPFARVFAGFTAFYFNEPLGLTQGAGFPLIALGAALVFRGQL